MESKIKALVDGYDQFIGIDHHKEKSYITIKDRNGEVIKRENIRTGRENLKAALKTEDEDIRRIAVFECGRVYRPMYKWLIEEVDRVVLAHPAGLKIISDTVRKNDQLDSEKLCDLLMIGMVPESYPASDKAWGRRLILRQRAAFSSMRTSIKNRIHVIVDLHPEATPKRPQVEDIFCKTGMQWLEKLKLPRDERWCLDKLLEMLEFMNAEIASSDAMVRRIVKEDKRCQLLKTVPGIGDFFSALIIAEIDDISRFPKRGNLLSYIGLIPGQDQSGEVNKERGIHKHGNKYLRWALVEAATPARKSNLAMQNLYDRICARKSKKAGPNIAKVAVARKLAEIIYVMLRDERPYEIR